MQTLEQRMRDEGVQRANRIMARAETRAALLRNRDKVGTVKSIALDDLHVELDGGRSMWVQKHRCDLVPAPLAFKVGDKVRITCGLSAHCRIPKGTVVDVVTLDIGCSLVPEAPKKFAVYRDGYGFVAGTPSDPLTRSEALKAARERAELAKGTHTYHVIQLDTSVTAQAKTVTTYEITEKAA